MEINAIEVLIGAAAAAALFCDYLRRRAAKEGRRPAARVPAPQIPETSPPPPVIATDHESALPVRPSRPLSSRLPESPMADPKYLAEKFEMNPRKALAEWLDQRAAARAAQKRTPVPQPVEPAPAEPEMIAAIAPAGPEPLITDLPEAAPVRSHAPSAIATEEPLDAPRAEIRTILRRALESRPTFDSPVEEMPEKEAQVVEEPRSAPETKPRGVQIDEDVVTLLERDKPAASRSFSDLWNAMSAPAPISEKPRAPRPETARPATATQSKFELIRGSASAAAEVSLPAGMYDAGVLQEAIASGRRFSGFVLSIGVTDNEGRACSDRDLMRTVGIFISSLLTDNEFACPRGNDEFLIVAPGPQGGEAQCRLTVISEQLWDYQLRNAHRFSLVFTWGSAEARHESLAESIAEASERMVETRRTRRVVSVDMLRTQPRAAAI